MYQQLVIKHIRCIPCNRLIDAKQFRTTETNKALQDERIEAKINSRHLPGFPTCPTCKKKVVIVDPPKPTPQAEKPIDREKAPSTISSPPENGIGFARKRRAIS